MPSSRHTAIGLATLLFILALAAWMVVVPRMVEARLDPLLRARFGGEVVGVGRVGVALAGPVVRGLEVRHPLLSKLPPARTRLQLEWRTLWASGQAPTHLRGRTRFDPGAEIHWQAEVRPAGSSLQISSTHLPLVYLVGLLPPLPWEHPEDSFLDLEVQILEPAAVAGDQVPVSWEVAGHADLRSGGLHSPLLAAGPVTGIDLGVEFTGTWLSPETSLGPFTAGLSLPPASFRIEGRHLHWTPAGYGLEMTVVLPETPCADVLAAIPGDLLGEAAKFGLTGRLAGRAHLALDSRDLENTGLDMEIQDGCRAVTVPPQATGIGQATFKQVVALAEGEHRLRTAGPGTETWRILPAISPWLLDAVLVQEDAGFFEHTGFSLPDIRAALVSDLQAGATARGASTLTMQLARNLFLAREKTLARKLQEVLYAWWLEQTLSKDDILEMYLNVVEFGPRLYGAGPAAEYYFQEDVARLGAAQAAFLTVVLPAPYRIHDQLAAAGGLPPELAAQVRGLLRRMAAAGYLAPHELRLALADVEKLRPRAGRRDELPAGNTTSGMAAPGGEAS